MSRPENVNCPECKGPMISRKNNKDGSRFWGCKDFPDCKGTRDSNGESAEDRRKNRESEENWDRHRWRNR